MNPTANMEDYLRLVSYAVVILTSLRGIYKRKFTNVLFFGDILMCLSLIFTVVSVHLGTLNVDIAGDYILTPGAVIWAIVHFYAMLKS